MSIARTFLPDAFVAKLNPTGTGLVYGTFLGGGSYDLSEYGHDIAVDGAGSAYVTGWTTTPSTFLPHPGPSMTCYDRYTLTPLWSS